MLRQVEPGGVRKVPVTERSRHWDTRERRWNGSWVGLPEGRGGKLGEGQTSREVSRSF